MALKNDKFGAEGVEVLRDTPLCGNSPLARATSCRCSSRDGNSVLNLSRSVSRECFVTSACAEYVDGGRRLKSSRPA